MDKKPNRWWDVLAAIGWLAIMILAASRIEATEWARDLDLVTTGAVLSAILGLAVGWSRFSARTATWLAVIYSVLLVPWILGSSVGQGVAWLERLYSLGARLGWAVGALVYNQPIRDPLLLISALVLIFWLLALTGGYHLVRHGRPWVPLALTGLLMMLIEFFNATLIRSAWYSAGFAFVAIFLIAQIYFRKSYRDWEAQNIFIDSDTEFFRTRAVLITVFVLVVMAWILPFALRALIPGSLAQQEVTEKWTGLQERFNNIFGSFQGPVRVEVWTFGNLMTLSTGQPNSDLPLFKVETPLETLKGTTYYWRARSYDTYKDGQWLNTINNRLEVIPNVSSIALPPWTLRSEGEFVFESQTNLLILYSPGLATTISRPVEVTGRELEDGALDFVAMEATPMVRPGDRYSVTASLASPTIAQLRVAGDNYPEWVTQKYLQIPADLPQSIQDLAAEITNYTDTPYEKTVAITNYLRRTIKYSETIPNPPKNADPLEWFLFEHKQGFCQYYATAEVLLLRAAGVPARLVVGYAPGDLQGDERTFQVRAKHSHAWPEVYFPDIGWIEFEPTAGLDPITRPLGEIADLY
ncbi:MAG TPA: transglutaminase domain-containing protein, partial [Anaerolineaceae bacterium]|nr:transglutaminase domain-containing protein [Anaerolineaceae bacterium]